MEKKVIELCEGAKRAAEAAAVTAEGEEARCIDALDQLNKFCFTCQLLVSTQVVRHVMPLTRHPRKKIQDLASDLIVSWRNMFLENDGSSSSLVISAGDDIDELPANVETLDVEQLVKVQKTDQTEMETTNFSSKNIVPGKTSRIRCNDCMREIVREKICDALCKVYSEIDDERILDDVLKGCDPIEVAIALECAMFEKWGHFISGISSLCCEMKYRTVMGNLKDPKNRDFRRKVLVGQVKPERVVNMSTREMASDRMQEWYKYSDKERARLLKEREAAERELDCLKSEKQLKGLQNESPPRH